MKKQMLKISGGLAIACICLLGSGCSEAKSRAYVMAEHPDSEVMNVPDEPYRWIIRKKDGSVWYCFSATGGASIDLCQLFPPNK